MTLGFGSTWSLALHAPAPEKVLAGGLGRTGLTVANGYGRPLQSGPSSHKGSMTPVMPGTVPGGGLAGLKTNTSAGWLLLSRPSGKVEDFGLFGGVYTLCIWVHVQKPWMAKN